MSGAINGLLKGEFLRLPYAAPAATLGTISLVMAVGLHALGFRYNENVITAAFTIAAIGGIIVTAISAVAYPIIVTGMQKGNETAWNQW